MKKTLRLAGMVGALGACAGVAHAQSNVTLYGVVDEGLTFNTNSHGARQYSLVSGEIQASRWGLKGTEDLGGGMKAIFVLENGMDLSSGKLGQGGLMFGRQAFVGLSTPYGMVTLGRQYDSVVDYVGLFEIGDQWGGFYTAHPGDLDNINNSNRVNNAIKYTSNNYGGFTFGGVYSPGGVAGHFSQNQIWSLGGSYYNGPLGLGVGYLNIRNPNTSFYGTSALANTTGSAPLATLNNIASPVFSGFANARTQEVYAAGGAYTYGAATFGGTYSYTRFDNLDGGGSGPNPAGNSGNAMFNNVEANFKYQLTTAWLVGAAYDYTRGSSVQGREGSTYHQAALGTDYFLSKRTDLYFVGIYQKASGTNSTGAAAVAAINGVTPSDNNHQLVLRVGMRHKF
ncbi:porin [Paraburkholderia caballeronis]|uniref:Outer membrane protein (Porin) n=1 Tax=Paraburkholderia caballeronis TaxID=416943 RepID=A0A1H7MYR4_9BURK|nr:porin [Paraburkholderia caballeronis]PXW26372.1 putative porin [Paraburkholderia caballeronis]PXX01919.1 putative porin [Paraburkholderia caballeronis]RAK01076.1 putative porin [Paraburkholderia caballeronis]TDV16346.1 putative porin [Paraburkholderia caballeronis]TDV20696.1 putative porin [Paraburkholderia caballeronis]